MGKAVVALYSGTGNAKRAAGILARELTEAGTAVRLVDLSAREPLPALAAGELLVVCSSTLGFSLPSPVIKSLKAMPPAAGARAAVLCVCGGTAAGGRISGGWSGAASIVALAILRRKGLEPAGSADASYPENWTQVTEAPKGTDGAAIIARGDGEAMEFGRAIASGRRVFLRRGLMTRTVMRLVGFVFRNLVRRLLGRLYIADDDCTACGLCARSCPSEAIVMDGGLPRWNAECSACNRCINLCPAGAIQTSTARLVLIGALNVAAMLASPPLARGLLRAVWPRALGAGFGLAAFVAGAALYVGFTALQIGPLDALVRAMERSPALRPRFARGFTKRFERYLAPGFKPGEP